MKLNKKMLRTKLKLDVNVKNGKVFLSNNNNNYSLMILLILPFIT